MNKLMKRNIMIIILIIGITLTGCYSGEAQIYSAMKKMQEIESMESTMEMDFDFSTENFTEEEQLMLSQAADVINSFKIKMDLKQTQNKDQTKSMAEVETNIHAMGMDMNMRQWVDVDLSGETPKMEQIIKMPEELMGTMVPEEANKEYIYFDMMNQDVFAGDLTRLMEFAEDAEPELMKFIEEFYKDYDSEVDFITKTDGKVINGEKLDIYEINIDDALFKDLVKYGVNHTLENENTMNFIREYMDVVMSITAIPEEEKAVMESEIKEDLNKMEAQIPEFKKSFNQFMEKYKDIQILGKEGITVEIGIDKNGYIVHEDGKIDLRLDISEISEAMGVEKIEGIVNLGINYKTKNYNINDKSIKIEMPKLTKENSIEYMELLEEQQRQFEEQLKQFEDMEDLDYDYIEESLLRPNLVDVTLNGEKQDIETLLYEGKTYVPLREISEILGKDVEWDSETKTANISGN